MKKIKFFVLFAILLFVATPKAEALLDIFTVYSKRNNTIEKIILEAVNSPNKEWVRTCVPIPEKYESSSTYAPKGIDRKDPSTCLYFEELYLAKHPSLRTLNDLYIKSTSEIGSGFSFKQISNEGSSITFETFNASNQVALKEHNVKMIVDLGNSNFRLYTYKTKYENIKEEEKIYWIQLFQYMEEQIKYVPS